MSFLCFVCEHQFESLQNCMCVCRKFFKLKNSSNWTNMRGYTLGHFVFYRQHWHVYDDVDDASWVTSWRQSIENSFKQNNAVIMEEKRFTSSCDTKQQHKRVNRNRLFRSFSVCHTLWTWWGEFWKRVVGEFFSTMGFLSTMVVGELWTGHDCSLLLLISTRISAGPVPWELVPYRHQEDP